MPEGGLPATERVDAIVGGDEPRPSTSPSSSSGSAPFGIGNPGVRLLVPAARVSRRAADGGGRAPRPLQPAQRQPAGRSGVAFGVGGSLTAAERGDPLDVSVRLELNRWNGAVEPRVVLASSAPRPRATAADAGRRGSIGAERSAGAGSTPSCEAELRPARADGRPSQRRARRSIAAAASGGGDRRRARLQRGGGPGRCAPTRCAGARSSSGAARPARFGGGEPRLVSRAPAPTPHRRPARRGSPAPGRASCSPTGGRWPATPRSRAASAHLVARRPAARRAPRGALRGGARLPASGRGRGRASPCLRARRAVADAGLARGDLSRAARPGRGRRRPARRRGCPRGVRAVAARSRPRPSAAPAPPAVLAELGLICWERSGASRALRVVSSSGHGSGAIAGLRGLPRASRGGQEIPAARQEHRERGDGAPAPADRRGHTRVGATGSATAAPVSDAIRGADRSRARAARRPARR